MDYKMKTELNNLVKMGFTEEMATIIVSAKYNKLEISKEIIDDLKDENTTIQEELNNFIPLEENIKYNYDKDNIKDI